jgi:hypothetical protein
VDSIEKSGGKNSVWLVERRAGATVFKTALQPGLCVLNWTSAHSGGNISRHGDGIETACKADIRTTWKWSHLAAAEWSADLDLAPLEPGGMLPQRVVLKLPSGVHLYDAQGDALRKVSVESGDAQSSPSHQVVLELTATPSANFHLTGVAFHDTASAEWIVSPFSPLGNIGRLLDSRWNSILQSRFWLPALLVWNVNPVRSLPTGVWFRTTCPRRPIGWCG